MVEFINYILEFMWRGFLRTLPRVDPCRRRRRRNLTPLLL
jgi:hypothetical protein